MALLKAEKSPWLLSLPWPPWSTLPTLPTLVMVVTPLPSPAAEVLGVSTPAAIPVRLFAQPLAMQMQVLPSALQSAIAVVSV